MIENISYITDGKEYVFQPSGFNMLIGRSGTGKTLFLKSLFASICNTRTGVPIEEIKSQMRFDSDAKMFLQFDSAFNGTVFYFPSCEAYFESGAYTELPLHIRKTIGVYNSWKKRGYDFDAQAERELGISASYGGLMKAKVFMAVLQEIKSGDIILVDLPEAGVDAILWKWWIDKLSGLAHDGVQVFITTHDFFVYTYVRSKVTDGKIFYFTENVISSIPMSQGIPDDAPILRVPIEVLEGAM
ncbi:hypothetical protein GM182_06050 [bacterium 3DAC]|nr:hypothetical protein GM182_06050 [bacterium 3DAC]